MKMESLNSATVPQMRTFAKGFRGDIGRSQPMARFCCGLGLSGALNSTPSRFRIPSRAFGACRSSGLTNRSFTGLSGASFSSPLHPASRQRISCSSLQWMLPKSGRSMRSMDNFAAMYSRPLRLLAAILIAAAWIQVLVGLRPLEVLRTGIEKIRVGNARRLSDKVPSELQPLVAETNRLLEAQEKAIESARARAGDLAHGLKTPLTALTALAGKLREQERQTLLTNLCSSSMASTSTSSAS